MWVRSWGQLSETRLKWHPLLSTIGIWWYSRKSSWNHDLKRLRINNCSLAWSWKGHRVLSSSLKTHQSNHQTNSRLQKYNTKQSITWQSPSEWQLKPQRNRWGGGNTFCYWHSDVLKQGENQWTVASSCRPCSSSNRHWWRCDWQKCWSR